MGNKSSLSRDLVAGLVAVISLPGCGREDRIAVYPVTGKVLVDGRPAAGVDLQFCPVDEGVSAAAIFPRARTDNQGQFELSTYEPGDGVPVGQYRVTASWKLLDTTDPEEMHADVQSSAEEKLDGKFLEPDLTPLQIDIAAGVNELSALNLETAKKRKPSKRKPRRRKP